MPKRRAHDTSRDSATSDAPVGRRVALQSAGALGAFAMVASSASPSAALADVTAPARAARPAWSLDPRERSLVAHALVPLTGRALEALRACEAAGVRVVEAFAPRAGGLPFVVEILPGAHPAAGERRSFELLRRDPAGDAPIAAAGELALMLRNRGDGARLSDEHDARLALRMGAALEVSSGLLAALELTTAAERRRRAPFATLHVPTHFGEGEGR